MNKIDTDKLMHFLAVITAVAWLLQGHSHEAFIILMVTYWGIRSKKL